MTHELRIERIYDAKPEAVFDAFVDPNLQADLHGAPTPGWVVERAETDVRVGGTSTYAMGTEGVEPDVEVRTFTVVDRPHRLEFRHAMTITEWGGRTVETDVTMTFEDVDGKTRLTFVQSGFDTLEDRDAFNTGWPEYFDTLGRVIGREPGEGDTLKTRHD